MSKLNKKDVLQKIQNLENEVTALNVLIKAYNDMLKKESNEEIELSLEMATKKLKGKKEMLLILKSLL
jgi:regulator of replication initiation timing